MTLKEFEKTVKAKKLCLTLEDKQSLLNSLLIAGKNLEKCLYSAEVNCFNDCIEYTIYRGINKKYRVQIVSFKQDIKEDCILVVIAKLLCSAYAIQYDEK